MKKDSLIAGIILIITLVAILFGIPRLVDQDSIVVLERENTEKQKLEAERMLEDAKQTKERFDDLTPVEQEKMITQIPQLLEQPELITQLSEIGEKNNTELTSLTFSKQKGEEGKKPVSVIANFRNQGPTNPSNALLFSLENNERLLNIKSFTFLFSPNRSDFSFTMESYHKEEKK